MKIRNIFAITALVIFTSSIALAQTTTFTYQGSLQNAGSPATGNYDFEVSIWNGLTGGNQLGANTKTNIPVANGVYTLELDFGSEAFNSAATWLEIRIRPAGDGSYTLLTPRVPVRPQPLAIRSSFASTAQNALQLGGIAANNFALTNDARFTDQRAPTAGSASYIQNSTTAQASSNFNISGTGSAAILNANQINLGGIKMLSNGGNIENVFIGLSAGQSTAGTANAFVGMNAGAANTTGSTNAFFGWQTGNKNTTGSQNAFFGASPGASNTTGSNNSFFGRQSGALNTTGNNNSAFGFYSFFHNTIGTDNSTFGFEAGRGITTGNRNTFIGMSSGNTNGTGNNNTTLGYQADVSEGITNGTALGNQAKVTQSNSLVLGSIFGLNGANADTNVGIGTTTPASRLHVNGTVRVTNGAVYITNPNTVIITSPNGACWGITVGNTGTLATFPVNPCP